MDLGANQDPYEHHGKWEWDLVRSARVVLDIGINYFGWTRAEALRFWNANIPNQDDISEREINRMFNWPAQVLAYQVGERKFLELRKRMENQQGKAFDLKKFHAEVLARGSIPLPVLDEIIGE